MTDTHGNEDGASPVQVGQRARAAIRGAGMAQRSVAERVGLDETKLSKSLKGQRRFTPQELTEVATATGVTANWLITGSDTSSGASFTPAPAVMLGRAGEPSDQARRRHVIVEQAWRLFAEHGVDAVRIADIASAAGTSSATVHYYYSTKSEIFGEALRYSVKLAFDRQISQLGEERDLSERLRQLVSLQLPQAPTVVAEWSIWLQTWARTAVGQADRVRHDFAYDRWQQTVRAVIDEGQRAGVFTIDLDADELALELTALIDGLGVKVLTGRLSAAEMAEHIGRYIDRVFIRRRS